LKNKWIPRLIEINQSQTMPYLLNLRKIKIDLQKNMEKNKDGNPKVNNLNLQVPIPILNLNPVLKKRKKKM